jgi:hypothetical protein
MYKKPVIIYDKTTLPEAAYGLGIIVDRDTGKIAHVISRLFNDEKYYDSMIYNININRNKVITEKEFAHRFYRVVLDNIAR